MGAGPGSRFGCAGGSSLGGKYLGVLGRGAGTQVREAGGRRVAARPPEVSERAHSRAGEQRAAELGKQAGSRGSLRRPLPASGPLEPRWWPPPGPPRRPVSCTDSEPARLAGPGAR